MQTVQLTDSERESFRSRGVLRLSGLLQPEKVTRARDTVRARMRLAGIWKENAWYVDHLRDAPINEGAKYARKLKGCPEFMELVTDEIPWIVSQLIDGQKTFSGMDVPQPLFTLPNTENWNVPHSCWHLDVPRLPNCGVPGVQIFTFLETVSPTGGGTLVVAGSHRLLNGDHRISSRDVKRKLQSERYFRDLMSKRADNRRDFLDEVYRDGEVELQVVELCGEPGDVYFVDLRTLHAPAPNATNVPRIMLTRRYFLEALRAMIYSDAH